MFKKSLTTFIVIFAIIFAFSTFQKSYALNKEAYFKCGFYGFMFVYGAQDYVTGQPKWRSLKQPTQFGQYDSLNNKQKKRAKDAYKKGWKWAKKNVRKGDYFSGRSIWNQYLNLCYEKETGEQLNVTY